MESLKNNIDNISDDTQKLVNDYMKMFTVRQSEKFALFLGIIATAFILTMLLLVIVVLISFALAGFLNELLDSRYWGTAIVIGLFLLFIIFLVYRVIKTKMPLLSNLFARIIISVFDLDLSQNNSIQGLRYENETLKTKIETGKDNIKTNVQMLRYVIMESLFREFFGLFIPKRKKKKKSEDSSQESEDDKE